MGLKEYRAAQAKVDERELANKEKEESAKSFKDERVWNPTFDKSGVAKAVIRFLGQPNPTKTPWVKFFTHTCKRDGKWFIEECSWTIKQNCPVCQYVNEAGWEKNKDLGKKNFYVCNILVVKDELAPENEGKVFLFKFGNSIFDTITKTQEGYTYTDEEGDEKQAPPRKVFSIDEGCDMLVHVYKKEAGGKEQNQYDKCKFKMKPSPLCGGDDDKLEKVIESLYDLSEFTDPKKFKSEEELNKKLAWFLKKAEPTKPQEGEGKGKAEGKAKSDPPPVKERRTLEPTKDEDDDDLFSGGLDDDSEIPF